jgi:hypothetical protein
MCTLLGIVMKITAAIDYTHVLDWCIHWLYCAEQANGLLTPFLRRAYDSYHNVR